MHGGKTLCPGSRKIGSQAPHGLWVEVNCPAASETGAKHTRGETSARREEVEKGQPRSAKTPQAPTRISRWLVRFWSSAHQRRLQG